MSVAEYSVYGEIVAGSTILVAEYPSKPGGCGIWYKLPNGNKQTAFPKAELEAFFRSQNLDIEIQVNDHHDVIDKSFPHVSVRVFCVWAPALKFFPQ